MGIRAALGQEAWDITRFLSTNSYEVGRVDLNLVTQCIQANCCYVVDKDRDYSFVILFRAVRNNTYVYAVYAETPIIFSAAWKELLPIMPGIVTITLLDWRFICNLLPDLGMVKNPDIKSNRLVQYRLVR